MGKLWYTHLVDRGLGSRLQFLGRLQSRGLLSLEFSTRPTARQSLPERRLELQELGPKAVTGRYSSARKKASRYFRVAGVLKIEAAGLGRLVDPTGSHTSLRSESPKAAHLSTLFILLPASSRLGSCKETQNSQQSEKHKFGVPNEPGGHHFTHPAGSVHGSAWRT